MLPVSTKQSVMLPVQACVAAGVVELTTANAITRLRVHSWACRVWMLHRWCAQVCALGHAKGTQGLEDTCWGMLAGECPLGNLYYGCELGKQTERCPLVRRGVHRGVAPGGGVCAEDCVLRGGCVLRGECVLKGECWC